MKTSFTENVSTLTKFLKKTYKDVINDDLNASPMAGTPMHIYRAVEKFSDTFSSALFYHSLLLCIHVLDIKL